MFLGHKGGHRALLSCGSEASQGLLIVCVCVCLQGRQGGVEIDPWEDADYSIYKVIDRFGFMQ